MACVSVAISSAVMPLMAMAMSSADIWYSGISPRVKRSTNASISRGSRGAPRRLRFRSS